MQKSLAAKNEKRENSSKSYLKFNTLLHSLYSIQYTYMRNFIPDNRDNLSSFLDTATLGRVSMKIMCELSLLCY